MSLAEKLKKCFEEGTRNDERHQGLKKTKPNKQKALEHLAKAKHNLRALIVFHDVGFSDWSASAAFYALIKDCWQFLRNKDMNQRTNPVRSHSLKNLLKREHVHC